MEKVFAKIKVAFENWLELMSGWSLVKKKENAKATLKGEFGHQEKTSERILSKNSLSIVVLRVFRRQEKVCLRIMYPI